MNISAPANAHSPSPQGVYNLVVEEDTNNYYHVASAAQENYYLLQEFNRGDLILQWLGVWVTGEASLELQLGKG